MVQKVRNASEQPCAQADMQCRFCLETENTLDRPLISPCRCCGTMKYVHRHCLDEWRIQSLNPKSLFQCTTCSTTFRLSRQDGQKTWLPWWLSLLWNLAWYLGLRALIFVGSAFVLGFMSPVAHMHPNPAMNYLLGGSSLTLAMVGGSGMLYTMWHLPVSGNVRLLFDLCPKRSVEKKAPKGVFEGVVVFFILVGACVLLWFLVKGIYKIVCDARHGIVDAARGVNAQARRKLVQQHVVLDFVEDSHAQAANC